MSNQELSDLLYLSATLLLRELTAALQSLFAANLFATPDNVGPARYQVQVHKIAWIPGAVALAEIMGPDYMLHRMQNLSELRWNVREESGLTADSFTW